MNGLSSVSVLVPCYQAEAYLAATLRSVLNQTHPPLEILVVDNNSTDSGPEIAADFGAPVRLLSEPRPGACHARMAGLAQARGETVMFLDADDLLGPEALEGLAGALAQTPGGVALGPWKRLEWVGEETVDPGAPSPGTGAQGFWMVRPASCRPRGPGEDPLAAWLTGWWHSPCSVLWSREGYRRSGGWDPDTSISGDDDGELMRRALALGVPLAMARKGEAFYRRLPGETPSLSGKRRTPEGAGAAYAALARLERQLETRGDRPRYAAALAAAYARAAGQLQGDHPDLRAAFAAAEARLRTRRPAPPPQPGRLPAGMRDLGPLPDPEAVRIGEPAPARKAEAPALQTAASEPLVSVVIPTYNRAEPTVRAVRSALAQDWPALEVIVVDDASTDDTAFRIEAIGDPRLRLIRQPRNGGVARARNRGIDAAQGEIIGFVDSDDEWLPQKLALQVPALLSAPRRTGIVHGASENLRNDGRVEIFAPPPTGRLFETLLETNVLHAFPTMALLKREVIETVGGFDPSLPAVEDWEFEIRAARFFDVTAVEAPVARYWAGEGERRSLAAAANLAARHMLHRRYWRELRAAGVETAFLKESARRHLASGLPGRFPAARTLLRALRRAPARFDVYVWLASCALPGRLGSMARRLF